MHPAAGCLSLCRGAESCCRSALSIVCEERLRAKAHGGQVFGSEHAQPCLPRDYHSSWRKQHSHLLWNTHIFFFFLKALSVRIKYHSSNDTPSLFWSHVHLVTWSGGAKRTNQWSVWDSSLCKHWEKKIMHSCLMGETETFGHDASVVFITKRIFIFYRNSTKMPICRINRRYFDAKSNSVSQTKKSSNFSDPSH